jgi:hypothetical protein
MLGVTSGDEAVVEISAPVARFQSIRLWDNEIGCGGEIRPLSRVRATIELADDKSLCLVIEGPTFNWFLDVPPKRQSRALDFVRKVNAASDALIQRRR